MFDFLIVGAGFAGAVAADQLARLWGQRVLLVDRRGHVGGNAYDCLNSDSILVHRYGPHIFHTNSEEVFRYLSRFTAWRPYEHRVLASVSGKLVPVPINRDTVNALYSLNLETDEQVQAFFTSVAEPRPRLRTSEDVVVSKVGRDLYEKLFKNYTRKQWGKDPSELSAQVTARIPVRTNADDRYFGDTYQAMPAAGFTALFHRMLDHPNITVELGTNYRDVIKSVKYKRLIYTGPIDEFFQYRFGPLPYRSLHFEHETKQQEWAQPVAVINYPNDHEYTRVTEFKHLTGQSHRYTSVVYEFPRDEGEPYYPVPTEASAIVYKRYAELAEKLHSVTFLGRLASYRYYNMDQVVAQSLKTCARLASEFDLQPHLVASLPAPVLTM